MAQTLVNVVTVTNLAAGATTTLAHGLESNNAAVAPTLVFPDRPTGIAVQSVTTTNVVFVNNGLTTASANFRCERGWQPEVNALTVTPLLYAGGGTAGGASGVQQVASQSGVVAGFAANTDTEQLLATTYTVPGGTYKAGSTVRVRVAGAVNVGAGPTEFTLSVRPTVAGGNLFATLAKTGGAALANGTYPFVLDILGTVESVGAGAKCHGSAQGSFGVGQELILQTSNGNFDTLAANAISIGVDFSVANNNNNVTLNTVVIDLAV
jgi:hypothetical protein